MQNFDANNLAKLFQLCSVFIAKKGERIVNAGEYCKFFMYVEHGLIRQFSIDEKGKEHNVQFAPETWFIGDRDSVYCETPTTYYFEALEDTTFYKISPSFIEALSKQDPEFSEYNLKLLHKHIIQLQKRINLLLSATAEERYMDFIKTYPNLSLRISQIMIASYLGIAPESLSRVRKDLANKHKI